MRTTKRASRSPAVVGDQLHREIGVSGVGRIDAHIARDAGSARRRADRAELIGLLAGHGADAARAAQEGLVGGDHLQVVVGAFFQEIDAAQDRVALCRASTSNLTPPSTLAE